MPEMNLIQGPTRTGAGFYPEPWDSYAYNRTGEVALAGSLLAYDFFATRAAETVDTLPEDGGTSPFGALVLPAATHLAFGQFAIVLPDNSPAALANDGLMHVRRYGIMPALIFGTGVTYEDGLIARVAATMADATLTNAEPAVGIGNATTRKVLAYTLVLPSGGDADPAVVTTVWFNGTFGFGTMINNATA